MECVVVSGVGIKKVDCIIYEQNNHEGTENSIISKYDAMFYSINKST